MRLTEKQVELKGTHADMAGGSVAVGGELDYAVHPAIAKLRSQNQRSRHPETAVGVGAA